MKIVNAFVKGCLVASLLHTTSSVSHAQCFPNTWSNTATQVGIGTTSPLAGYELHVVGDIRLAHSPDFIDFSRPASENGFAFLQNAGQRADIRFSGNTLRLLARGTTPGGPPATTNGINIKTNGFVGIGNDNPSYRLNVNDNSNSDYGSWISANSKGPALFVRRDATGTNTGSGTYINPYGGSNEPVSALVVENLNSTFEGQEYFAATFKSRKGIFIHAESVGQEIWTSAPTALTNRTGLMSRFDGADATNQYGIVHYDNTKWSTTLSQAITGDAHSFGTAIGVRASAIGTSNTLTYGIYATASSGTVSYAGYFPGNVYIGGTLTNTSDVKLKENVNALSDNLNIISKLSPKSYTFKQSEEFLGLALPEGTKYGLIAQEVEQILPGIVKSTTNPELYDGNGKLVSKKFDFKSVDYISLIPFLIGGIKEQQQQIEELKSELSSLKEEYLTGLGTEIPVSKPSVLYQNNPNPFTENTIIKYELNGETAQAYIMIFDMTGAIIKKLDIEAKTKNGEVIVNAKDLKPGMYIYSLITDNKEVDTKRMIINK